MWAGGHREDIGERIAQNYQEIKMKRGKKTIETDISFPASQVWQVYSTLELPEIIKTIPNYVKDLKVTGDGSVGITYYDIWNVPGHHLLLSPSLCDHIYCHANLDGWGTDRSLILDGCGGRLVLIFGIHTETWQAIECTQLEIWVKLLK